MAKREAQAHQLLQEAGALTDIERAEQALAERVKAFTEASEALRAEIKAFEASCAKAEGRPAEPVLRLVVSRETAEMDAIEQAGEAGRDQAPDASEAPDADDDRPTPEEIADFFRRHAERKETEKPEPEPPPPASAAQAGARPRNLARERLYADLGGAAIGICSAAALINFVLLR